MSYFLFVDESGHDLGVAPYEVLAGVCIQDFRLWDLVQSIRGLEDTHFGMRISKGELELKGKKLLKKKTFRLASQMDPIPAHRRWRLARRCIRKGHPEPGADSQIPTREELTALGQAKIAFVEDVLRLCERSGVIAFASIIHKDAPRPPRGKHLRKDYSYLFERFFYFIEVPPV